MLRRLLPLSRLGLAMWAWRNRASIADWTRFAARSASSLARGGSIDDARAEMRLRASLAADRRTRGAASLSVSVVDGLTRVKETVEVPMARRCRRALGLPPARA